MYGQGDFVVRDDDLKDYNDLDFETKEEQTSHTPVQTPQKLDSESEGEDETRRDLEEGQKADEDIRAAELARRAKRIQEFETLSQRLSENGYKMRMKVWADPTQSFRPIPMTTPTMTLAEILQTIPSEDAEQISEFQGLVYMPEQFMPKYLLPTMQIRKLLETENEATRGE